MKKKKYRVSDYKSVDECLDQMARDGYRPVRRMEKPVFEERGKERVPVQQDIVFEAVEKE
ncbi:NETI motif-containing protein [Halalkalibacillus sediminis]|uniref:NETI motif-containing protein n=1 Tax=Halalkalibacillus sediminis TaxID=2018042 RepID=A0A2I0QQT0_9BACI|nr:NETI motif-containing protein [Halalkalibacillus sediminis]PKR76681.1 NETI motif-containing protein [Halalkalibacillus sediminis]